MKKFFIVLALMTTATYGQGYQAPKVYLKSQNHKYKAHDFKVKKESDYDDFKVHNYRINEKPVRKRDLASRKNGGRLPSSETIEYHQEKVYPWPWN